MQNLIVDAVQSNLSGLYNAGLNNLSCDALIFIYIKNLHDFMVTTFEDVEFLG